MRYLLAGDSTVAACEPNEARMSGWGARLHRYLDPDDSVHNFAVGGATTESFRNEGHWRALLSEGRAGDTVVIQFGHNDQKQPELLAAGGGYTERLGRFIAEATAAGASVVVCTSAERRLFDGDAIRWSHGAYPSAVRRVAQTNGIALIDLTAFTTWLYRYLGVDRSGALFTPSDNTHFHEDGADAVASFVALSLRGIEGRGDGLPPLGKREIVP